MEKWLVERLQRKNDVEADAKCPWTFKKWSSRERKATGVWKKLTFNFAYYPAFQHFKI